MTLYTIKNLLKHSGLLCILLISSFLAKAQYPVQVVPQLVPPASLSLSDYHTGAIPKLYVTLTNRDLLKPELSVHLRIKITSNNISLRTDESKTYVPITLDAGVPNRLFGSDLEQYFNPANLIFQGITREKYLRDGKLPEGLYTFCFEVIETNTNRILSQSSCAVTWISHSDPPLLNTPRNYERIKGSDPTYIIFNWTPRHQNSPTAATNSEYEFELVEVLDRNVNPNNAFQSSAPVYKVIQRSSSLVYGPAQPLLIIGKRYAWRVQVKAIDLEEDHEQFRNNGYSDVYIFDYVDPCPIPDITKTKVQGTTATVYWDPIDGISQYTIHVREPGSLDFKEYPSNGRNHLDIPNLDPDLTYDFYLSYPCRGQIIKSGIANFKTNNSGTEETKDSDEDRDGDDPVADVLKTKKSVVNGKVYWAYAGESDDKKLDFETDNYNPSARKTDLNQVQEYRDKTSLAGARVQLWAITPSGKKLLKTVDSDNNGYFNIETVKENEWEYELVVVHESNLLKPTTIPVSFQANPNTAESKWKSTIQPILGFEQYEIDPKIFVPGYGASVFDGMVVEVLMEKDLWNRTLGQIQGNLNVSKGQETTHNGQQYYVVASLKNGQELPKLPAPGSNSPEYILRVSKPSFTTRSFVVPRDDELSRVALDLNYLNLREIRGKITFNSKPASDVSVQIRQSYTENKKTGWGWFSYSYSITQRKSSSVRTNQNGEYVFLVPSSWRGNKTDIEVGLYQVSYWGRQRSIDVKDKFVHEEDFDLYSEAYTYAGQLKDPDGNPIENAQVTLIGAAKPVRTTKDGYFLIQGPKIDNDQQVFVSAPGYASKMLPRSDLVELIAPSYFGASDGSKWWNQLKKASIYSDFFKGKSDDQAAGLISSENPSTTATDLYTALRSTYANSVNKIGIYEFKPIELIPNPVDLKMAVRVSDAFIAESIVLVNTKGEKTTVKTNEGITNVSIRPGKYTVQINPTGTALFIPFELELLIKLADQEPNQQYIFDVIEAFEAEFLVKDEANNDPLKDAIISIEGFDHTAQTDKDGLTKMLVPKNRESSYKFSASLSGFGTVNKMLKTEDIKTTRTVFALGEMDVPIVTISGFEVTVTSQQPVPGERNMFSVSGTMKMQSNKVFKVHPESDRLPFNGIQVELKDEKGNSEATSDFAFDEATMKAYMFDKIPVEVNEVHFAQLDGADNYDVAVIRGNEVTTVLSEADAQIHVKAVLAKMNADATVLTQEMFDAPSFTKAFEKRFDNIKKILNDDGEEVNSVIRVFVSKDKEINALREDRGFDLQFDLPEGQDTIPINLIPKLNLNLYKSKATIDKDGIKMQGFLRLPPGLRKFADKQGRMMISEFGFNADLNGIDIIFNISRTNPYTMRFQKIQAKITHIGVRGIGSVNTGVSLGGKVWMTRPQSPKLNAPNAMTINQLEFVNKQDGITLSGDFTLPRSGVTIKSLNIKTRNDQNISFSFNFSEKTFELEAAGYLTYAGSNNNPVLKKIFPLDIRTFNFKTKNWSFLIAAAPNTEFVFGPIKVSLDAFVVNVGTNMPLRDMGNLLLPQKNVRNADLRLSSVSAGMGNPDDLVEEANVGWAFGISGSIGTSMANGIKGVGFSAGATILFGNINDKIQVDFREIRIGVVKKGLFELEAALELEFSPEKTGLSGQAKLILMGNGLEAKFHFYKYTAGGVDIGAELKVFLKNPINTGPVGWLSIGGGFRIDTRKQEYEVWLSGQITNAGGRRELMYVDIQRIGVKFAVKQCGAKPVFDGGGTLYLKQDNWASIKLKADFCRGFVAISINARPPMGIPGLTNITVTADLFASKAINRTHKASFILIASVRANIAMIGLNGNATFAIGVNQRWDHPYLTNDIKNLKKYVHRNAQFGYYSGLNGISIKANVSLPEKQGSYGKSLGPFSFSVGFRLYARADAAFYYNFTNSNLGFEADLAMGAHAWASVSGVDLRGGFDLALGISGGYINRTWQAKGYFRANAYLQSGRAGCNSVSVKWGGCFTAPYPCGVRMCGCGWFCKYPCPKWCMGRTCPIPVGFSGFKLCLNINGGFEFKQGQSARGWLNF